MSAFVIVGTGWLCTQVMRAHGRERAQAIELARSRSLVDIAARAAHLGGWSIDLVGGGVAWSDEVHRIHGTSSGLALDPDDVLGRYVPEHRESIHALVTACAEQGRSFDAVLQIQRADGRRVWVRAIGQAVRDTAGRIIEVQGAFLDVDETHRLREETTALSERIISILESMSDAFFVLDRSWRFRYMNPRGEALLERSKDDLLGREIWEVFPETIGSRFQREFTRAAETGESVRFEQYFAPLDRLFEIHASPSDQGLGVYFRDVTERRQVDARLHLLEVAVSRLNDVVMITEAEPISEPGPRIVYVNSAFERLTGYPPEETIGRSPRFLQGIDTDHAELGRIRRALEAWQPVRSELLNYKKTGEPYWSEIDIVPIADETGWFTHWVAVERDVTERHRVATRLHEVQRMEALGQLTGGIAHDFNNLLTVIEGNAGLLVELLEERPVARELAEMIATASDRAGGLTQRLLAFARKQPLSPRAVELNQLVSDMEGLLRRTLGEHIELQLLLFDHPWAASVDPVQLENALLNLCINARDAMPRGGRLTIETANTELDTGYTHDVPDLDPGEYAMVVVSDTGFGMPPDVLQRAFEPFFTTKETGDGTGLGLSMVYGFVKQSRGHVRIYSEVGTGTTVRVYLPRADGVVPEVRHVRHAPPEQGGTGTILVVEDDELVRRVVADQLSLLGYSVVCAPNGPEALRVLQRRSDFDLLFTDVVMPGGMSGRELAERARALYPYLPVLYTSGYAESAIVHHGRLDPGVRLLSKPYRRADLARQVRDAMTSAPDDASSWSPTLTGEEGDP